MNYNVKSISVFEKQAKRLIKKYASLKKELSGLIEDLKINPAQGTSLGNNCYKIRLAIAAKGKGKRGGARVITNVVIVEKMFTCLRFMISRRKPTCQIMSLQSC